MDCYWNLPVLIPDQNRTGLSNNYMRDEITKLYTMILLWQMKMICFKLSSRHEDANLLVNLHQIRDWDGSGANFMLDASRILYSAERYASWEVVHHIRRLGRAVLSTEMRLRNINSKTHVFVCDTCGNLDPDIWWDMYFEIYLVDVRDSSSRCPACEIIFNGVSQIVKPLDIHAQLSLSARKNSSLKLMYSWGARGRDGSQVLEFFVPQGMFWIPSRSLPYDQH
jgi:hypothetical protein